MTLLAVSLLLASALGAAAPHPSSASRSIVRVDGARVELDLRVQTLSLLEVLDADANGNAFLEPAELERARGGIEAYVLAHFRLRTESLGDPERGRPLAGRLRAVSSPSVAPDPVFVEQWVDLVLDLETDAPLDDLLIDMTLFLDTSPAHFDDCTLIWNGAEPARAVLRAGRTTWFFRPESAPRASTLRLYLRLGFEHIIGGWDHLAFLLALIVAARSVAALVGVVTAFTVAHSITLALAAFDVVRLEPRLVEVIIALSIAYVGAENLVRRGAVRGAGRWLEVFVFGLVHGLGFAGFLGQFLGAEPNRLTALVAFNLGVEVGQLAVVIGIVLAGAGLRAVLPGRAAAPRAGPEEGVPPPGLAPRWLRLAASTVVTALGLFWFVRRAGFL